MLPQQIISLAKSIEHPFIQASYAKNLAKKAFPFEVTFT